MPLFAHRFSRFAMAWLVTLAGYCAICNADAASAVVTVPGMPPVAHRANLYGEARAGHMSPAVARALPRIYVPNLRSNDVYVIDPTTYKIVDRFHVGASPQNVVPSWDLQTLWVANNAEGRDLQRGLSGRFDDVVYAIDTATGSVKSIPVGMEPHGLTVWPQPGRYSLGHTGNMR